MAAHLPLTSRAEYNTCSLHHPSSENETHRLYSTRTLFYVSLYTVVHVPYSCVAAEAAAAEAAAFALRASTSLARVAAMRAIWSDDTAQYSGDTVKFGPMQTWPKPIQRPYPPVFVGGGVPFGARRALAYGDGWVPHALRPEYRLLDRLSEFRDMASAAGRSIPITAFGAEHQPDAWLEYKNAGIDRIVLSIDSLPTREAMAKLDGWAKHVGAIAK